MIRPFFALAAIALAFFHVPSAGAQQHRPDSVRADRMARDAQSKFEIRRRVFLPLTISRPNTGCEEQIGRYCYWSADLIKRPEDSPGLKAARNQLITLLDAAAVKYPGSDWITGQRVRYRIEAQDYTDAIRIAASCHATISWCRALHGLALHFGGNYFGSEQAFDRALESMSASERCKFSNIAMLLEGDLADDYRKRDCQKRQPVEFRIWRLADPAYSIPGNDRRTEHFARQVMDAIYADSRLANGNRWGPDASEIMLRYGIYNFWTREPPPAGSGMSLPSITDHQATPSFHFLPAVQHIDSLKTLNGLRWKPTGLRLRERYAPNYAKGFIALDPQILRFVRGDSVLLVSAYDVSGDTAFRDSTVRAALVGVAIDSNVSAVVVRGTAHRRDTLSLKTATGLQMVGIEVLSLDSQVFARSRAALLIPPVNHARVSLSDILLFETDERLAKDLDDAMARMVPSSRVNGDKKVGLYWEINDLNSSADQLPVALTLTRQQGGTAERIRENLGIKARDNPLSIRWIEPLSSVATAPRSVLLDLSLVPRGKYNLRIALGEEGRPLAVTQRSIELR